jgi:phosphohistidine phosphatase
MPTLILMRHAKSDYPPGVPDIDRPLSDRGRRDAEAAGQWLAATYPHIDHVVLSPARRAQETWDRIAPCIETGGCDTDACIYDDWGAELARVVTGLRHDLRSVLIVGHNPGIEEYARDVIDGGDDSGSERLLRKYPTSGIAVIRPRVTWGDRGPLACFAVPRG